MQETIRAIVMEAVLKERELQDAIWKDATPNLKSNDTNLDYWWSLLVTEKNGIVASEILEESDDQLLIELIQLCAIYYGWTEYVMNRVKEVRYEKNS